jgi:predicted dehydrogenase
MMSDARLHMAILGCGSAARLHSRTLRSLRSEVRCSYASRNLDKAKALEQSFGGRQAFGSYEEALDSDADLIFIALPPNQHLDWTLAALEAGKNVIVEKPAFPRSSDFDTVQSACEKAGRRVLVAENYYYKPLARLLRRLLGQGVVGDVLFINLNALKRQETNDWRDDAELATGGALLEGGIHWINLLANIGLTPRRARGHRPGEPEGLERNALVTLEYEEGAVATFQYSWDLGWLVNGIRTSRIYGREGTIRFETNGLFVLVGGRRKRLYFPGIRDLAGYHAMFRDFFACLRGEREPEMTLARAKRDAELVEQAYASM